MAMKRDRIQIKYVKNLLWFEFYEIFSVWLFAQSGHLHHAYIENKNSFIYLLATLAWSKLVNIHLHFYINNKIG